MENRIGLLKAIIYTRNGLLGVGGLSCLFIWANLFFHWIEYSLLHSLITVGPFLIAFNLHLLYLAILQLLMVFEDLKEELEEEIEEFHDRLK